MKTRSKPPERNYRVSTEGANCSKETRQYPKRLEKLRTRSKPQIVSKKGQTARKRLENFERYLRVGANRSKVTKLHADEAPGYIEGGE